MHRHTHRVVRGALVAVGRPDGRLAALTSLETSVTLSVSQASSIQSLGETCESLTIGHNPSVLALAAHNVFLERHRRVTCAVFARPPCGWRHIDSAQPVKECATSP